MEKEITEVLKGEFRRRLRDESLFRILKCLDLLDEEQIWKRPNESTNSVGNLVLHLCGNIRQYILTGIGGAPESRARDGEFAAHKSHSREMLKGEITAAVEAAIVVVSGLPTSVWTEVRPVQVFEESVMAMAIHVIEHTSYHTGQIALLTKWQLDRDLGFYAEFEL
jgi:uncharacterized damage-inducible protein DinB